MTSLTKTVRRKVVSTKGAPLVVALAAEGIWLKEPRRRVAYLLPFGYAFQVAVGLHVAAERRAKKAARAARMGAK